VSSRGLSFAVRSQTAGEGFRQIANRTASSRTLRQDLVQVSANLHKAGTVAVAYAMGAYAEGRRREIATLSHNLSLQGIGHVSVSVSRTWSQPNSTTAWLTFTAPLGAGRSASLSAYQDAEFDGSRSEAMATLQQSPPVGPGVGYRLSASSSGNYSGAWRRHFDAAAVEIEAAKRWQTSAVRTTLSGGATAIGGGLYATRWVDDSFALVDLGGISDIDVFVDNHVVGRTDDDGKVLISDLRSYDVNRISFNPRQLPLDARFVNDKLSIRPGYRSGVVVGFPIARERSATLRLIREDGSPAPAGAEVILNGQPFPIGLDGYVYVAGLEHGTDAEAQWNGGRCVFRIPSPEGDDPLPDMGAIICRTSTPH
jgi:outer membrane usher protein